MSDTLKPGLVVAVFQDPITCEDYEGIASLVERVELDLDPPLERWRVRFLDERDPVDPFTTYDRTINAERIAV